MALKDAAKIFIEPELNSTLVNLRKALSELKEKCLGQEKSLEILFISLLSEGHVLIEGQPGLGKTHIAKQFASILGLEFKRIQMTSDLMPSELTGGLFPTPDLKSVEFRKGPLFANLILADELNRCSPKTQSALLEAMAESTVSIEGKTWELPKPFMVIATQNPQEHEGVFALAESQLDRFAVHVEMKPPEKKQSVSIFESYFESKLSLDSVAILGIDELKVLQKKTFNIHIDASLKHYVALVLEELDKNKELRSGVSVRAALQLLRMAQARALLNDRAYVKPDDIRQLVIACWAHRLQFNFQQGSLPLSSEEKKQWLFRELSKIPEPT